jgi:hypothetical protein
VGSPQVIDGRAAIVNRTFHTRGSRGTKEHSFGP